MGQLWRAGCIAMGVLLPALAGCRVAMLNVDDVIVPCQASPAAASSLSDKSAPALLVRSPHAPAVRRFPDQSRPVELRAYLEQRRMLSTIGTLSGVQVSFHSEGETLGTVATDERGRAVLSCDASQRFRRYCARANLAGGKLESTGVVFAWPVDRPTVVIDLDETLLQSRYVSMILWLQDPSPPAEHAREIVRRLSERYGIIYVSTRARLFRNMTQDWLAEHDFPAGPIVHSNDISAVFDQRLAKFEMVQRLQKQGLNIVAGIGDKAADELAFDDCGLATIIIRPGYSPRRAKTSVLADWSQVEQVLRRRAAAGSSLPRPEVPLPLVLSANP